MVSFESPWRERPTLDLTLSLAPPSSAPPALGGELQQPHSSPITMAAGTPNPLNPSRSPTRSPITMAERPTLDLTLSLAPLSSAPPTLGGELQQPHSSPITMAAGTPNPLHPSRSPTRSPDDDEIYADIWKSLAGDPIHIPQTDSYCYYFAEGHLEQNGINSPHLRLNPHISAQVPPAYLCKVTSWNLEFHAITEEPFVRFQLQPEKVWYKVPDVAPKNVRHPIYSHSVLLTPTDLEELTLPDAVVNSIFLKDHRAVQVIKARDVFGKEWQFEWAFRSDRHVLSDGWREFVLAKALMAGESIVFIRRSKNVFVSIKKSRAIIDEANEALSAIEEAERGRPFYLKYYPLSSVAFVISAAIVFEASEKWWLPGIKVSMLVSNMPSVSGEVTEVVVRNPERGDLGSSGWNMIKVNWPEGHSRSHRAWMNAWDLCYSAGTRIGPVPRSLEK